MNEKVIKWLNDYNPDIDNLHYKEYAKDGFISGYKESSNEMSSLLSQCLNHLEATNYEKVNELIMSHLIKISK